MHKSATKCNETVGKWCKNKHGALKIIDTLETYQKRVDEIASSSASAPKTVARESFEPEDGGELFDYMDLWVFICLFSYT
jgi:hypothetical protein